MDITTEIALTTDMRLLLILIGVALVLFAFEWVAADVTALGLLVTLILTGLVPADQAFAGFGSDTVFTLMGLFILTAALLRTGVVERTGRLILRHTGDNPNRLLLIVMTAVASLSAVMSNTASTAFFVPIVLGLANRLRVSAGKLLMPLAFASILASSVSLVSTSTNIVISGLMTRYGLAPLGMFELTPVGIPIAIAGVLYMLFIGRRLLPDRTAVDDLSQLGNRLYLTEVVVLPNSPLIGKTLVEAGLGHDLDIKVLRIIYRESASRETSSVLRTNRRLTPRQGRPLRAGDILLVEGDREALLNSKATVGLELREDLQSVDPNLPSESLQMVEVLLLPRSPLIGETLVQFNFRERYGLQVLAIYRHGETLQRKLSHVPLRVGDVLLIQGARSSQHTGHAGRGRDVSCAGCGQRRCVSVASGPCCHSQLCGRARPGGIQYSQPAGCCPAGGTGRFFDALYLSRRGLSAGGVARARAYWQYVGAGHGDGIYRNGNLPGCADRQLGWNGQSALAVDRLFCPGGCPHPADVQPGLGNCRCADCAPDGNPTWSQPAHLCHDDRHCCQHILFDAPRTFVPHGLRTRELPLC
ncbi:MAG: SLC13 family permease [Caldilineaceae bacterium]